MKTLIETWRNAGDDWDEWDGLDVPDVIEKCADDLESACTPRAPKAEWFGDPEKEPGKWDAWAVVDKGSWRLWICHAYWTFAGVTACVPVARTGFPALVGWGVVGG